MTTSCHIFNLAVTLVSGLSLLLDKQQAGTLTESERTELVRLMQLYQSSLLQKAEGLAEAVQRGLRPPLTA